MTNESDQPLPSGRGVEFPHMVNLLGISGSLRRDAHSTGVLRALAQVLKDRVTLDVLCLNNVPMYNADLDYHPLPEGVQALKQAISQADGIVVCSPEYNYGIPGVLKNAIDWASRPAFQSPLKNKPILIMTNSPGTSGGLRAQAQIRDAFSAALARPIARQHVAIPNVNTKLVDERIVDATTEKFALEAVDDLIREVQLLKVGRLAA